MAGMATSLKLHSATRPVSTFATNTAAILPRRFDICAVLSKERIKL